MWSAEYRSVYASVYGAAEQDVYGDATRSNVKDEAKHSRAASVLPCGICVLCTDVNIWLKIRCVMLIKRSRIIGI